VTRQLAGETFLNTEEVKEMFGWSRDSLYRFHRQGLTHPQKFLGDKKTYWAAARLEALKSSIFERGKAAPGPQVAPDASPLISPEGTGPVKVEQAGLPVSPDPAISKAAGVVSPPERDLAVLQVWLNNYPDLSGAEKQEIWQIAHKRAVCAPELETLRPEEPDFTDRLLEDWKRERPEIDENLFALFGRLQRAGRSFDRDVERALDSHGLKPGEFIVLAALRRAGPPYALTPTELFRSLLITSGTITKRLARLEARRLVERRPDPEDGRGSRVYLTRQGKELVDAAVASPGEEPYRWLQRVLTPLERKLLERFLRKMLKERESEHLS
jgi:DNA-binding MarR family transcriptional regulator